MFLLSEADWKSIVDKSNAEKKKRDAETHLIVQRTNLVLVVPGSRVEVEIDWSQPRPLDGIPNVDGAHYTLLNSVFLLAYGHLPNNQETPFRIGANGWAMFKFAGEEYRVKRDYRDGVFDHFYTDSRGVHTYSTTKGYDFRANWDHTFGDEADALSRWASPRAVQEARIMYLRAQDRFIGECAARGDYSERDAWVEPRRKEYQDAIAEIERGILK